LGDDTEMPAKCSADALHDRALVGHLVEREVGLRLDVRVERPFLDAERLSEIADRRAVIALLGEEPGGGPG
jgi:hypothetical protein